MGEGKLNSVLHLEELEECERRRVDNLEIWPELQKHCKVLICKFKQIYVYMCFNFLELKGVLCRVYFL